MVDKRMNKKNSVYEITNTVMLSYKLICVPVKKATTMFCQKT